jgi:Mrp family chromosome partitioning ATPase
MSKTFELLQQIGNDEQLFRTAVQPNDEPTTVDAGANAVLDQEMFESLMEKVSEVGLFQTSSEPPQQILILNDEVSPAEDVKSEPKKPLSEYLGVTFQSFRNPANLVGEGEKNAAFQARQIGVKPASLPGTLPEEPKPKESSGTVSHHDAIPSLKRKVRQRTPEKQSRTFSWTESIKGVAKAWERKGRIRSNYGGADLEAITREEEMKLVRRVFPGTSPESPRVALFTGLESEAGCAPTCARVAEILAARSEGPVCVVDANFRTPSLHEYFGVENLKGLAEATVESGPVQSFAQQIPEPDLWLITSGKASGKLRFPLMADGLRVRMEELRDTFKYVIIHSGPLRLETSAMLLSRWTDGVVLVLEANATRRDAARRVKETLDAANVSVLGVVLNNRTFPIPEAIYRRL